MIKICASFNPDNFAGYFSSPLLEYWLLWLLWLYSPAAQIDFQHWIFRNGEKVPLRILIEYFLSIIKFVHAFPIETYPIRSINNAGVERIIRKSFNFSSDLPHRVLLHQSISSVQYNALKFPVGRHEALTEK